MTIDARAVASIYTYPWDISDEGGTRALENIRDVAGLNDVALAMSYHLATYFLPHNPVRKIYRGEDGMVMFHPNEKLYEGTAIRPKVSEVVDRPDYLRRQVDSIREKGITLTAWIVYAFNHHLPRAHPECARVDALGNIYPGQLCIANPDVRRYFTALTQDVMEQFSPDAVHIESLSYLRFDYGFQNPKVLTPITPWCQLLLGLCMCAHCMDAAARVGLDGRLFRREVADFLRHELPKLPDSNALKPQDNRAATAFRGRLKRFMEARDETAFSLFKDIVDIIKAHGKVEVHHRLLGEKDLRVTGLAPARLYSILDEVVAPSDTSVLRQAKKTLPADVRLVAQVTPSSFPTEYHLEAALKDCRWSGAEGFNFYNYGLMRLEHLQWLGDCRHQWKSRDPLGLPPRPTS